MAGAPDGNAPFGAFEHDSERHQYVEALKDVGELKTLTLLEARDLGDDRIRVYDATFDKFVVRVRLAVAPDGKLAVFALGPRPAGDQ